MCVFHFELTTLLRGNCRSDFVANVLHCRIQFIRTANARLRQYDLLQRERLRTHVTAKFNFMINIGHTPRHHTYGI